MFLLLSDERSSSLRDRNGASKLRSNVVKVSAATQGSMTRPVPGPEHDLLTMVKRTGAVQPL